MRTRFSVLAAMVALAMFAIVPASHADNIFIGLQQGGPIVTVSSGTGVAGVLNLAFGTFLFNSITATGTPPNTQGTLGSTSNNVSSTTSGTINVYVSETGLTQPTGPNDFISSLT